MLIGEDFSKFIFSYCQTIKESSLYMLSILILLNHLDGHVVNCINQ